MRHYRRIRAHRQRAPFLANLLIAFASLTAAISAFAQEQTTTPVQPSAGEGVILTLDGPVTPPVADYLAREIGLASDAGKDLIVINIDTPGGLVDSMKTIIKAVLASKTPVATYVSPQGARSASAGLYIMYSAHISAMAPATNTGAATPVNVGGAPSDSSPFDENDPGQTPNDNDDESETSEAADEGIGDDGANEPAAGERDDTPLSSDDALRAKVINDSVAYIRSLAQTRGRNADWAESAVRDAVSITANDALSLGVIDLVADDLDDLLSQIDGRTVATAAGDVTVNTKNIKLETVDATPVERLLSFIANPNVAVI